ncbi:MAG: hypothetical protein OSB29_04920 [Verrucomicrobiota bacterium]|nr:hypothetical protein [Verrucomicrobiota bacterium]
MDFIPIENLMSWTWQGLRALLLVAIFGGIVWGLSDRRVRHIAALTWKTAVRLRFIWVMVILILFAVGGLPAMLRDDGSAKGMAQIILTYTLSMTTGILGLSTLWLAVGSMAQDISQCQMQMVVTKPIARWQIWLGKWLGIMGLNLLLLGLAGTVVYGMVEYRAGVLTTAQYERLKDRTDVEIKQEVGKALGERRLKLDEVYILDKEKHQLKLDDNQRPILQPMETLKRLLAELPERELREKVLVARAPLELEDVKVLTASGNGINSDSYMEWRKLQRENDEKLALMKALERVQAYARAEQDRRANKGGIFKNVEVPQSLPADIMARIRSEVRMEYLIQSQVMRPQTARRFSFRKPRASFAADRGLVLRFQLLDTRMNFKGDRQYRTAITYGPFEDQPGLPIVGISGLPYTEYTARTQIEEPMRAMAFRAGEDGEAEEISIFGTNNLLYVNLMNAETPQPGQEYMATIKLPFLNETTGELDPRGVEVMYYEGGFFKNYLRALAVVFAWLGALAALGLMAASFMSLPMAVFACTGILVISFCTGLLKDVVKDDTIMQTYSDGVHDTSVVDYFAINSFKLMVAIISPVKDYSPIEDLTEGRAITWDQLGRAYSYIWGVTGLLISGLGMLIFTRRQLAITDNNE